MRTIKAWFDSQTPEELRRIREALGVADKYLYHLASGFRKASPLKARQLAAVTNNKLPKHVTRPDIFDAPPSRARNRRPS